jgi:hypothetical protein
VFKSAGHAFDFGSTKADGASGVALAQNGAGDFADDGLGLIQLYPEMGRDLGDEIGRRYPSFLVDRRGQETAFDRLERGESSPPTLNEERKRADTWNRQNTETGRAMLNQQPQP